MSNEDEKDNQEGTEATALSKQAVFVRGFVIRFALGAIPIGLVMLVRPDLRPIMVLAGAWFFLVCMMTAGLDVALKRTLAFDVRSFRLTPRVVLMLFLLIGSIIYLFVTR